MVDDFLTIPEAPNYEINSEFVVRNKRTGRILKPQKAKNGSIYYNIRRPDHSNYRRAIKSLRRAAQAPFIDDFLTIPEAPNYEINSEFVVRNKKTGRILKQQKDKWGYPCYSMSRPDHSAYCRSPKFLRRVALAANNKRSTYEPIPSLDNRYEINACGKVRNIKTKQVIKPKCNGKLICGQIGTGNYFCRAIADLLWEVHGIIKKRRFRPCPCSCYHTSSLRQDAIHFPHMAACARFLAPKVYLSFKTVKQYLCKRPPQIGEWKIIYGDDLNGSVLDL